jgi:hypothetical protein
LLIEVIEHIPSEGILEIERITNKKIIVSTITPFFSKFDDLGVKLNLYGPKYTSHIKCYYLEDIPFLNFKLKKSKRYFIVDQFGVYERVR